MFYLAYVLIAPAVFPKLACMLFAGLRVRGHICDSPHVHMLGASACALHFIFNTMEEDQSSARLGNTHKEQGAFMYFLDPSFSSHLLPPPPAMTA